MDFEQGTQYTEYLKITYDNMKLRLNAHYNGDDESKQLRRRQMKSLTSVLPYIDIQDHLRQREVKA